MSDFKPRPAGFTAYLEYMQKDRGGAASVPVSPNSVIEILARQPQRAMAMADLETLSGIEPEEFRKALKGLMDMNYVTVEGPAFGESVQLTDKGAEAAILARPA